ncbi:unnamed protein product [Rotaria sp. Silwood2]|nr:unnamed protein product [Rotaria sp. Silwood2]
MGDSEPSQLINKIIDINMRLFLDQPTEIETNINETLNINYLSPNLNISNTTDIFRLPLSSTIRKRRVIKRLMSFNETNRLNNKTFAITIKRRRKTIT